MQGADDAAAAAEAARSAPVVRWTRRAVWTVWGALILLVLAGLPEHSPVKPSSGVRLAQLSVLPQGWSFFTRDPREPLDVFHYWDGQTLRPLTFANTSRRSRFGMSREARALQAETMRLLSPVLPGSWHPCQGDPAQCAAAFHREPLRVTNWSTTQLACGRLAVVRSAPVPWAWREARARIHMDSQVVLLDVDCSPEPTRRYR